MHVVVGVDGRLLLFAEFLPRSGGAVFVGGVDAAAALAAEVAQDQLRVLVDLQLREGFTWAAGERRKLLGGEVLGAPVLSRIPAAQTTPGSTGRVRAKGGVARLERHFSISPVQCTRKQAASSAMVPPGLRAPVVELAPRGDRARGGRGAGRPRERQGQRQRQHDFEDQVRNQRQPCRRKTALPVVHALALSRLSQGSRVLQSSDKQRCNVKNKLI